MNSDLYAVDLDGDILIGEADTDVGHALVSVDPDTGMVSQLWSASNAVFQQPKVSGGNVAWIEPAADSVANASRLLVLDLAKGHISTVAEGSLYQVDLKDDIVAWQELREQGWGVYAYDLSSDTHYVIADGPGNKSSSSVCNRDWVVYLDDGGTSQTGVDMARLRAHNLATNLEMSIGWVPVSEYGPAGNQHACDGERVAWIGWTAEDEPGRVAQTAELLHYDLAAGTERLLDVPGVFASADVQISGDVLVCWIGRI